MARRCAKCSADFDGAGSSAVAAGEDELCPACRASASDPGGPVPDGIARLSTTAGTIVDQAKDRERGERPRRAISGRLPPREFGRYEIIEEVSRGAMGIVYRAREKKLGRIVALKVLLAGEHASEEQVGRFIREARAIARLRHPNIVPIHDVGDVDGRHYFTMDYIEGEPLSRLIAKGRIDTRRALDIIESVADAVECAHQAGVIHRDIKPSNIMVDRRGRPQIMDFGLAKPVEGDTQYTRTGTTIGTPAYMPPEQARGDIRDITARSDIYSIGAVFYELVTGSPPFEGPNMLDVVLKVIHEEPTSPRRLKSRVHPDVETVILRAMEKDPYRRYASAADLRDDIRRFKAGEAIRARPPSVLRYASRWGKRHKVLLLWATTVLAAGGAFFYVIRDLQRRLAANPNPVPGDASPRASERPKWIPVWEDGDPRAGNDGSWEERASPLDGRELVPREGDPFLGSVKITATVDVAEGAKKPEIAIGLQGRQDPENAVPFYGVMGGGRIMLYGVGDIERSAAAGRTIRDARVLVERSCPELRPGSRYLVRFERRDLDVRFQVAGDGVEETILLRNLHLSNWRAKNLFPALGVRDGVKWRGFRLCQLLGGRNDAFDNADVFFTIGEYNRAATDYSEIVRSGVPEGRADAARLRLGMCAEVKRRFDEALDWYGSVKSRPDDPDIAAEARIRRPFCLAAAKKLDGAAASVRELASDVALADSPVRLLWTWELADLAQGFLDAKDYPAVVEATRLVRPPAGWSRMEAAAAGAAKGLASAGRAGDLLALAEACPSADLAPAFSAGVGKLAREKPEDALHLLEFSARRFPGEAETFSAAAAKIAKGLIARGEFGRVARVHRAWPLEAVFATFKEAVAKAIGQKRYAEARSVLAYAHSREPEHDDVLRELALALAKRLCSEAQFGEVRRVYEAYPDAALIVSFREAAEGLLKADDLSTTVSVLEYAQASFGRGDDKLAAVAAEISARFAEPSTVEEALRIFISVQAYPGEAHTPHVRRGMKTLAAGGTPQQALSLFAALRAHLPEGDEELTSDALAILEAADPVERSRSFEALSDVAAKLSADAGAHVRWLIELGDIACRVGGSPNRAEKYYRPAISIEGDSEAVKAAAAVAAGRLAVLLETASSRAEASVLWDGLAKNAFAPGALAEAARLLSGRSTREEFAKWREAHRSEMSEAEEALYLGLAARLDDRPEESAREFERARKETKGRRWPHHVLPRLSR